MTLDRRQLLKGLGLSAGALSVRGMAAETASPTGFTHGIASGDPLADRVILWSRYVPPNVQDTVNDIVWQISGDSSFDTLVRSGIAETSSDRDFTIKVDATGLESGQRYFYRFLVNGHTSDIGSTKTLPVGEVKRFRLGLASCSNYPQGYFHAYDDIAKSDLDVVLHLGDYLYEYARGRYVNPIAEANLGRGVEPANEILTVADYRQRYALYRSDRDLRAAHAAHPWICVWDDHELMNNTWKEGAENHNEGEGDFAERIAIARQVYHEWMPVRTAAQTDQAPIYRAFKVGKLADLIMLDTRLHGRDEQLDYQRDIAAAGGIDPFVRDRLLAPERTILGSDQENWLGSQLAAAGDRGATWQLIGQQVLMGKLTTPIIPEDSVREMKLPERYKTRLEGYRQVAKAKLPMNLDAWDGYPVCRERVHSMLLKYASNPVVFAGDTHNAWAFNMRNREGVAVGVEIGTPGVTSPGMEAYLPLQPKMLDEALKASSSELYEVDTHQRGWTLVELAPDRMTSQWRFVSNVLLNNYTVQKSRPITCRAGDKQFS
jgi:alkaline phosphatase D